MEKSGNSADGVGEPITSSASRVTLQDPTAEFIEAFRESMPAEYRAHYASSESGWHARVAWRRREQEGWLELRGTEGPFTLCTVSGHRPDLLSALSAATIAGGVDVSTARTFVRTAAPQAPEAMLIAEVGRARGSRHRGRTIADVESNLREAFLSLLAGEVTAQELVRQNSDTLRPGLSAPTEVEIGTDTEGHCWLRVTSADRPGLLAAIAGALRHLDVWPQRSEVSTIGGIAVDRFSLAERDGSALPPVRWPAVRSGVLSAVEAAHRSLR